MQKNFDHNQSETHTYELWEKAGAFNPDEVKRMREDQKGQIPYRHAPHGRLAVRDDKDDLKSVSSLSTPHSKRQQLNNSTTQQPFSIIMPPPNANDPLHVGHAMFISIEDILIRYHRMKGDDTIWIPGTDHAGIETQFVFEKKLAKQGKSRFNFDRDTLYKMIWDYVQENSGVAVDQMKKLGASADWSRFTFTLDPSVVKFVTNTFKKMHQDGLVYRDQKLVHYCVKCGTSYSELEVVHKEQTDKLYYLKYGPFTLATTRPETKFADTAVAVHPDDTRYKKYIGTEIEVEGLTSKFKMKVIADEYVDSEFGTGVVKITPYHDFNDYEVWQRHKNEIPAPKQVIGFDGKLTAIAGKYAGMKVKAARDLIEKDLQEKGLLEKVNNNYLHTVGVCYRCGTVLEPLPLPQFFIKVKDKTNNLTQKVLEVLDKKETKIYGAGREKILRNWLENLKDWNISRQIVWGIRIPVWYPVEGNEEKISVSFINQKGEFQKNETVKQRLDEGYTIEEMKKGLQQVYPSAELDFVVATEDPGIDKSKGKSQKSNSTTTQPHDHTTTRPHDNTSTMLESATSYKPQASSKRASSVSYFPETDTFDTWFSSGQWPVVTLKTNNSTTQQHNNDSDFDRFYPTTVMETAYDILLFWVMRMMMMGIYLENKTPFEHVYLHGLVRDEKGQKMSKSKGNVINPLEFVSKYGADAVRMALVMSSTPGSDSAVGENKIKGMRNFSNKIWNASRFVMMALDEQSNASYSRENLQMEKSKVKSQKSRDDQVSFPQLENQNDIQEGNRHPGESRDPVKSATDVQKDDGVLLRQSADQDDSAFKKRLQEVSDAVSDHLEKLRPGQAAELVYNEFWHWFCDVCIEDQKKGNLSRGALLEGLITFLKLLHPFVPFVTEALWQELWQGGDDTMKEMMGSGLLIVADWPGK